MKNTADKQKLNFQNNTAIPNTEFLSEMEFKFSEIMTEYKDDLESFYYDGLERIQSIFDEKVNKIMELNQKYDEIKSKHLNDAILSKKKKINFLIFIHQFKIIESQPEKLDYVINNMQNEKHLEINFIDYKFNKLKEELILEMRRNISDKKHTYEKNSKDYFDSLKKSTLHTNNNPSNTHQDLRINSGLKSIREETLLYNDGVSCDNKINNEPNALKSDYPGDDIYLQNHNLNYDLIQQEDDLYYNRDERKLSGNNFYKHRSTGSKNSRDFSKKSISSTGKLTDDENLYVL